MSSDVEVIDADEPGDLDLFNRDDPRSLYNIVPKWLSEQMSMCDSRVLLMPEHILRTHARADARLNRIRLAFWAEYEEAQAMVRKVSMYEICRRTGISQGYIKQLVTANQYTVAYVLNQPVEYSTFLQEALNAGLGRLREILDAPITDPDTGALDDKAASLVLKATAFIDLRVNGGIVQKQLNINQNSNNSVHTHVFDSNGDRTRSAKLLSGATTSSVMDDLNAKIKELENKREYKVAREELGEQAADTAESIRGKRSPERVGSKKRRVLDE